MGASQNRKIASRSLREVKLTEGLVPLSACLAQGISRIADTANTMTHKGTFLYQAPELSRGERYGFPADIYSYAVTIYEVCKRDLPFTR